MRLLICSQSSVELYFCNTHIYHDRPTSYLYYTLMLLAYIIVKYWNESIGLLLKLSLLHMTKCAFYNNPAFGFPDYVVMGIQFLHQVHIRHIMDARHNM